MKQILISEPGTQVSVKLPVVLDTYGNKVAYINDKQHQNRSNSHERRSEREERIRTEV